MCIGFNRKIPCPFSSPINGGGGGGGGHGSLVPHLATPVIIMFYRPLRESVGR